jgi:hypothetical protein
VSFIRNKKEKQAGKIRRNVATKINVDDGGAPTLQTHLASKLSTVHKVLLVIPVSCIHRLSLNL